MQPISRLTLSDISAKGLLLVFILLTSLIFGGIAIFVLSDESKSTIKQLQSGNGQFELESAKIFMEQYLEVAEDRILLASQYEGVVEALAEGNVERLIYQLDRFKGQSKSMLYAARDREGNILFEDTFRHPASEQEQYIFEAITQSTLNERVVYLLHDDTSHICLKLFVPIWNEGEFVGLLYGETAVDYEDFFGSFITGRDRWYELNQNNPPAPRATLASKEHDQSDHHEHLSSVPNLNHSSQWIINQTALSKGDLVLTQGISKSFVDQQLSSLQGDLIQSLLVVVGVSAIFVGLIGKKLFVNPHSELARSKQDLMDANSQLMEKEEESHLLATVVRAARDAVIITDREGRVEWVNQAFESMTGYHIDGIRGRTPGSFLQGQASDPQTAKNIGDALRAGNQVKAEILNYTSDGVPYWVDIDITPLRDKEGNVERFIAIERDVTDFKQLETQLATAALEATSANQAKSKFLATMSHEIRTPMNGLLGLLQMLEEEVDDPQHRDVLKLALGSGEHLISILNDILDLAKIENDALELDPHPFSMEDVINPVVSTYQSLCSEKGVRFIFDNQCDKEACYNGDAVRIRQVLLNLVGNALKFTEQGHINVTISPIAGGRLEFKVQDTGIGIPQHRLESIFNEFEQAEISTNRRFGGTGLGLAICQKLVTLMKGELKVESTEGQGTLFYFIVKLPQLNIEKESESAVAENTDFSQYRVLIADDNKMNQIIAKGFLDKLNIPNQTCSNGVEVLEWLDKESFNLLIIDNHMPELNGVDTVAKIRSSGDDKLLIFGWTADIMQTSTQSFMTNGADEVLAKPLIKKDLVKALNRYVAKI
ncbi:PAS domain-containing hybrid sensor histidine kinase/response regulator [Vibrio agarivorans]|uniref:histidine kinase n=1 Tax=Vibrio agarivorans TaxID=153622 RepID=A0ABT7Y6P6_9VIBR|nr:PAS domain-containing hybrid sensor histidine kinase/response regulator [Vibrio agarivorans]MDN2483661.1 ATP-binding protein [Vibrio agarivorans]